MINKGFSFIEVLMAIAIFGILTLAMASFSSGAFKVMYKQGSQTEMSDQTRFVTAIIPEVINKSYYIFPAGQTISLTGSGLHSSQVNTSISVAVLISDEESDKKYYFKAFYIKSGNLYEFSSSGKLTWNPDTSPATTITSVNGTDSLIATDIDISKSSLSYSLNYNNGVTDPVLLGQISGSTTTSDVNALIKGISWKLAFNKESLVIIKVEGVSKNVPRFQ